MVQTKLNGYYIYYPEPGLIHLLKVLYFFRKTLIIFYLINLIVMLYGCLCGVTFSKLSITLITSNCDIKVNKNLTLPDHFRCLFSNGVDCFLQGKFLQVNVSYCDSLKGELNIKHCLKNVDNCIIGIPSPYLEKRLQQCYDYSAFKLFYYQNNTIYPFDGFVLKLIHFIRHWPFFITRSIDVFICDMFLFFGNFSGLE